MKDIYKIFVSVLTLTILFSCSDDELKVVTKGDVPVFSTDISSAIALDDVVDDQNSGTFNWTKASYNGAQNVVIYDVQLVTKDANGNDTFRSIATTLENSFALSGAVINSIFDNEDIGLDKFVDNSLRFNVSSYLGSQGLKQNSDIVTVNFLASTDVPVIAQPKFSTFFLVGNATIAGWDNANGLQPLFKDSPASTTYSHSGFFKAGEFKVIAESGNWQPQYGDNAGALGLNDGSTDDPASFAIPSDGNYAFEMDTAAMTYTLTAIDDATLTDYPTIGLIGDATEGGWDVDTDLIQSSFDKHVWYISDIVLKDGNVKFRANDAWDVSWGGSEVSYGIGTTANGADIPQTAGTYDIIFNDITGAYIILKK